MLHTSYFNILTIKTFASDEVQIAWEMKHTHTYVRGEKLKLFDASVAKMLKFCC